MSPCQYADLPRTADPGKQELQGFGTDQTYKLDECEAKRETLAAVVTATRAAYEEMVKRLAPRSVWDQLFKKDAAPAK